MNEKNTDRARELEREIDKLLLSLERIHLREYVEYVSNKGRLAATAFIGGMARGLGFAVGFSVLSAILVMFLKYLVDRNIPVISEFLAEVIYAVQQRL